MIHVIATIQLRPGCRADFLREFHALVPTVLEEQGCLAYGPAIDVETEIPAQQVKGDDVVTVVEQWESLQALQAHLAAPHMATYRESVQGLVTDVSLHVLQPA